VENDVHVVGVSTLAAGHKALVPHLLNALKEEGAKDILVVVGGVIPPADYAFLKEAGAVGVFGPGTSLIKSANDVLNALEQR
jgi:methylmalonyl-CoA mutase